MAQVTFKLVKVTQQIKGISFKNNKKGEHFFFSKLILPFVLFYAILSKVMKTTFLTNIKLLQLKVAQVEKTPRITDFLINNEGI